MNSGEHFLKGWVGGTQHFGPVAKPRKRGLATGPKCNKAAVGSRMERQIIMNTTI